MKHRTPNQPGETRLALLGGRPFNQTPFGHGPKHDLAEWRAIRPVFARGTIEMTRGPEVMRLREAFGARFGARYAVTASSGTAALHTAMAALGIGRGDEVITSPVTDMGTLSAILMQNAVPVLADVDPRTLMITPSSVAARLTPRTRAVIPVHLAGQPCDVPGIRRLLRGRRIAIVEDMAQSYLARQQGRLCGLTGDIGCWSLNETKHIGAGDGGMLLTNNRRLAARADLFADKSYRRDGGAVDPAFTACNYRLSTLTAAVCLEQLKKLDRICARRHAHGTRLDGLLAPIPGIAPRPVPATDHATYWYYLFHVDPTVLGVEAETFARALSAEGVPARPAALLSVLRWRLIRRRPLDRHACAEHCPLYTGRVSYAAADFPGLRAACRTAVRVEISEWYRGRDLKAIAGAVAKVAAHYRKRAPADSHCPEPARAHAL